MNEKNRPLSRKTVEDYKRELVSGHWPAHHQGIGIDSDGNLLDGQHRLTAISESGVSAPMQVTVGLDRAATFSVIDTGKRRSLTDALALHDDTLPNRAQVTALIRMLRIWSECDYPKIPERAAKITNTQQISLFEKYGREKLVESSSISSRARSVSIPSSALAAAHYLIVDAGNDSAFVRYAFIEPLLTGYPMTGLKDPRLALRGRLMREPNGTDHTRLGILAAIIVGWNAFVEDRSLAKIYIPSKQPFILNAPARFVTSYVAENSHNESP